MIDYNQIDGLVRSNLKEDKSLIRELLAKAKIGKGLTLADTAALSATSSPELIEELFATARDVKNQIYGNRLVLFAPLYISNICHNECLYCAFRASNKEIKRCALSMQQITEEANNLVNQGQKRILLVAGESDNPKIFQYLLDAIKTIYQIKNRHGEIRRINVNIAPLTLDDFKRLKDLEIGTYQLFQETYNPKVYKQVHISGKKADYDWRLSAIDRAMRAGIDDVGIGVLFGLSDWRHEILALLQHSQHLETNFGAGPHTISVPRIEPAEGSEISLQPPSPVSDADFCKIVAILRLAMPFTGIIMSTRENAELRRKTLALGVSQISAGSRTNPGGYSQESTHSAQFQLGDHRSVDEVIKDIATQGYIPSFCTACYRLGRTGEHFMDLAKSGKIKRMCIPNGIATFQEYLEDYASPLTKNIGEKLINSEIAKFPQQTQELIKNMVAKIKSGQRDVYI